MARGGGSPPHTRGRFFPRSVRYSGRRFTPAYAGKIWRLCVYIPGKRVHPRIRGEDKALYSAPDMLMGSPPHTRGRSLLSRLLRRAARFTPAYAGKIPVSLILLDRNEVHPRIRGEDSSSTVSASSVIGSPPHTRGRSSANHVCGRVFGFTPAYAGKIVL